MTLLALCAACTRIGFAPRAGSASDASGDRLTDAAAERVVDGDGGRDAATADGRRDQPSVGDGRVVDLTGSTEKPSDKSSATDHGGPVTGWASSFGGTKYDVPTALVVGPTGDIFIGGSFASPTISFGGMQLANLGAHDVFVASFTATGQPRWSKAFGSAAWNDTLGGLALGPGGQLYLTASLSAAVDFGGGALQPPGALVALSAANGAHLWSKSLPASAPGAIVVDGAGNLLLTGGFLGSVSFGGSTLTSAGQDDVFLVSYTPSGTHRWSKAYGGTSWDSGGRMVVFGQTVCVSGNFDASINFGGATFSALGVEDMFLAGLSTVDGSHLWSRHLGGTGNESIFGLVHSAGSIYIVGYYSGGTTSLGGAPLTGTDGEMFLASYAVDGTHRWSSHFGGPGYDVGYDVTVDSLGDVIVIGRNGSPGAPLGGGASITGAYVAALSTAGAFHWSTALSAAGEVIRVARDGAALVMLGRFKGSATFGSKTLVSTGDQDIALLRFVPP